MLSMLAVYLQRNIEKKIKSPHGVHQTPAGPPQHGDAYAPMGAWLDSTGSDLEWGRTENSRSGPNQLEDEGSTSPLVWPCHPKWRRISCRTSIAPEPRWTTSTRSTEEEEDGPDQARHETNQCCPRGCLGLSGEWRPMCQTADPAPLWDKC